MYLKISDTIRIPDSELEFKGIRASGPGGQNVNKVSSAIQLRFNVKTSSLSDIYKSKVMNYSDQRIGSDGVIIIKAQEHRTQEQNRIAARDRLAKLLQVATYRRPRRTPTKPTKNSKLRRLEQKTKRSQTKAGRGKVDY